MPDVKDELDGFLEGAETLLKASLGDLWDANKDECRAWLSMVARYQAELLTKGRTEHSDLTEKYLRAGTASLVRRMKGRAQDAGESVLAELWARTQELLKVVLSIAVSAAVEKARKDL